jgi:integral membrane protein
MSDVAATPVSRREPTGSEFIAMRDSAKFGELRRTYRSFTFP